MKDTRGPAAFRAYVKIHGEIPTPGMSPMESQIDYLAAIIGRHHDEIQELKRLVKRYERKLYPKNK